MKNPYKVGDLVKDITEVIFYGEELIGVVQEVQGLQIVIYWFRSGILSRYWLWTSIEKTLVIIGEISEFEKLILL